MKTYPEKAVSANERALSLIEMQHKRILEESKNGQKSIAYITVTHGTFSDGMAKLLKF
jgi:hypothetical protein